MKIQNILDDNTKDVLKKSGLSTLVKVIGIFLGISLSIILGKNIGPEGLGIIELCLKLINIIALLGMIGTRQVLIKEISIAKNNSDDIKINSLIKTVIVVNGLFTFLLTIIFFLVSPWISESLFKEEGLLTPLRIIILGLLPIIILRIFSSALVGIEKIWEANFIEQVLAIFFTLIILIFLIKIQDSATVFEVSICYSVGWLLSSFLARWFWGREINSSSSNDQLNLDIYKTALPLLYANLSSIISISLPVIILGIFQNAYQVGIFSVSNKIALLTSVLLMITNSAVSPKIARMFHKGEMKILEKMVVQITIIFLLIALLVMAFFLAYGKQLLNLWGEDFMDGYNLLLIIAAGQLINVSTGSVGVLLAMTGLEKVQATISIVVMLSSLIFYLIYIPQYGMLAAAIIFSSFLAVENLIKLIYVKKKLGINVVNFFNI